MKDEMHESKVQQALQLLDWTGGKLDNAMQIGFESTLGINRLHWEEAEKIWHQKLNLAASLLRHNGGVLSPQEMQFLSRKWGISFAQWKQASILNREKVIEDCVFCLLQESIMEYARDRAKHYHADLDDEQWAEAVRRLPAAQIKTALKFLEEARGDFYHAHEAACRLGYFGITDLKWDEAWQMWKIYNYSAKAEPSEEIKVAYFCIDEYNGDIKKAKQMAVDCGYNFPDYVWGDAVEAWRCGGDCEMKRAVGYLDSHVGDLDNARSAARWGGLKLSYEKWVEARRRWEYKERIEKDFNRIRSELAKRWRELSASANKGDE